MARIRSSGIRRGGNRASPEEQLEALAPTDPDREANPDALFEVDSRRGAVAVDDGDVVG